MKLTSIGNVDHTSHYLHVRSKSFDIKSIVRAVLEEHVGLPQLLLVSYADTTECNAPVAMYMEGNTEVHIMRHSSREVVEFPVVIVASTFARPIVVPFSDVKPRLETGGHYYHFQEIED